MASRSKRKSRETAPRKFEHKERYSVCETCGRVFEQIWSNKHKHWSHFKDCATCRRQRQLGISTVELPYKPHAGNTPGSRGQLEFHESKARYRVLMCGARWGKDRCSINEFIKRFAEMLSEDRSEDLVPTVHGWIVAPSFPMARQSWRELKHFFPKEWIVGKPWETDKIIETIMGGIIEVKSADDPEGLVTVGLDIVLITEAARIKQLEDVWGNIYTRLQSPGRGPGGKGGLAIINSTPRGRNFFYKLWTFGQKDAQGKPRMKDWESWQRPQYDNPYIRPEEIEAARLTLPDRIFRQEILAEPLAETNAVFPYPEKCATYTGSGKPEPDHVYVIGYDPARSLDQSGVVIRNHLGQAVLVTTWVGKPWTQQMDEIAVLSRKYNHARIIMDRTGLGEALPEALTQRGLEVEAVFLSNPFKEQLVNNLAMLIEQELISYPNQNFILDQLRDYEYRLTKTGKVQYSSSSQYRHDDVVTALMLAYKDFAYLEEEVLPYVGMLLGAKSTGKKDVEKPLGSKPAA